MTSTLRFRGSRIFAKFYIVMFEFSSFQRASNPNAFASTKLKITEKATSGNPSTERVGRCTVTASSSAGPRRSHERKIVKSVFSFQIGPVGLWILTHTHRCSHLAKIQTFREKPLASECLSHHLCQYLQSAHFRKSTTNNVANG